MKISSFFLLIVMGLFPSCYSFRGVSIPDDVRTFYVGTFENQTQDAIPSYPITITERLKDKIRNESRLTYRPDSAHVVFNGTVIEYSINDLAPQANDKVAFSQLRISLRVEFENRLHPEENWKQTFKFQQQFPSNVNLLDVQDELIRQINEQLVEDVFNKAFSNW